MSNSTTVSTPTSPTSGVEGRPLRPGDVVEVRPAAEILATLDGEGTVGKMPFMPEMLQYAGRRFTVSHRVDKICDMIAFTGSRRMTSTVYLEDLRCDGSGHGGCQAGCRIYWKEAWLRRVGDGDNATAADGADARKIEQLVETGTRATREFDGVPTEVWRCQATEAAKATERLRAYDLSQYWREFSNGNFPPVRFLRLLARAVVMQGGHYLGLVKHLPFYGSAQRSRPQPKPLGLKPGDLVQIRSAAEIAATLDEHGTERGLSFDREMMAFCGKTYRVRDRVERIVDEKTGRMLRIRRDCLILDGVACSGQRTFNCWFCPRAIYSFWREEWLRPVDLSGEDKSAKAPEPSVLQVGKD